MIYYARAPVRIDFAGGWTDVALFAQETPGYVVNACLNMYAYATAIPNDAASPILRDADIQPDDKHIRIYSADFDEFVEAEDIRKLEYNGQLDLVKAAIRRLNIDKGFYIVTRLNAPPGSGLGTSAAMGAAMIGALSRYASVPILGYEVAELANAIEREELRILAGKQDHYASAIGGINFMEFHGERVHTAQIRLDPAVQFLLEKHLVYCYTGKSRLSSDIHEKVIGGFKAKDPTTFRAIERLKAIARECKTVLMKGALTAFGELLAENWENQKKLHASVTNERIDALFKAAMGAGAIGGKAGGAGGGGCLVFLAAPEKEHQVKRALQDAGAVVLEANFDFHGLQVFERA